MKLGKKASEYYDHPTSTKDSMIHPSCHLPASMFKNKYKPGDTVSMKIKGKIKNMGTSEYHIEMTDGEEHESQSDDKKASSSKSLLSAAKTDT